MGARGYSSEKPREHIVEICRRLNAKNMLAAADGNVSLRLADDDILITPSGKNKAHIGPVDIATITIENQVVDGVPSGERLMHLEVYRRVKEARAIVHAHPPTAIAWSIAFPNAKELPTGCMSELILALGSVPIAPYQRPGTKAMGEILAPYLPGSRVMILGRHGAISWGEDLEEAYNGMERLEHTCQILKAAHSLGGITELPPAEIAVLREMREKMGNRSL
jgi:L-fuculose-phosphate aldolase